MPHHIPGELLAVRGDTWRLRSQTAHADCTELELEPADPWTRADRSARVLLEPFDRPRPIPRTPAPAAVTRRAWMASLLEALSGERQCDRLSAPVDAAIDILPYQLDPAVAMAIRGIPRVLLADAVGLGKTIQAALVIAELFARRQCRRALVLTPSGLRDQWADELRSRFGLEPTVADTSWLRAARADLPTSVNPWSVSTLVIASIDFVKRADVLRGLDRLAWDIVVIDEAHAASSDTLRREAAHALARRARRVMLLTATPHSGDRSAFDALCRIGAAAADEPVVLFRRSRADVGFQISRRVHSLAVRQTDVEREVHRHLLKYVGRIWRERRGEAGADARLASIVLLKRAFSSMASLAATLEFRLAHLADPVAALMAQLDLPLDPEASSADDTPVVLLAAPGFDDEPEERIALAALGQIARAAARADSKAHALYRLLRRTSDPCIVFTEYRDTLTAIERALPKGMPRAILHGGLDRRSRAEAVRQFAHGGARVLLATDAGGEGLNLQTRCRLVVNLELPWNPIRLEQRIGRVDRIGQRRTVHALNLVAAGTHEASLLASLTDRLNCIRDTLGSTDDVLGPGHDMDIAGAMVGDTDSAAPWSTQPARASVAPPSLVTRMSLREEAGRQQTHLIEKRAIRAALERRTPRRSLRGGGAVQRRVSPQVAAVPAGRLQGPNAQRGVLAVYRAKAIDGADRLVDDSLVCLFSPFMIPRLRHRADVTAMAREWLAGFRPACDALALQQAGERLAVARSVRALEAANGLARSRAQGLVSIGEGLLIQGGLFDRRTDREAEQQRHETEEQPDSSPRSAGGDAASADVALADRPELALLLMVTP